MTTSTLNTVGRYTADIVSGVLGETGNGNPQVVIQTNITGFVDPSTGIQGIDAFERRLYLSMHGGAVPYTEKKLKALGFNGDFANIQFSVTNNVELLCTHEPDNNGNLKERWDLANWGDAPQVKQAGSAVIQKMNALWKAHQGGGAKPTRVSQPKPSAPPPSNRPGPRPNPPKGATRDQAWNALLEAHKGKPDDFLNDQWQKLVSEAETRFGKAEAEFTPADWESVRLSAELPF